MLLAILIGGALFYRTRQTSKLTEKDSVVLTDFVNTTGDAVFDGTLKQALAVELAQSPYLNILPDSRVQRALRFMGRSPEERLTKDVAHEVCLREGVKSMLTGSIAGLGSHYVITLEAVNAQTGDTLDREQVEAESKEQVLKSLDRAASALREKLGESIGSIQKFDTPLESATTSSLDALKEFSLGEVAHSHFDDETAIPHLQRAVEIDPNFAMAWGMLGVAHNNLTDSKQGIENLKKAFDLKDRTSEREKFYISAHYYETALRQLDPAIQIYEQWKQTYPHDGVPRTNLSLIYSSTGQLEKSLSNALEALQIDSKDPYSFQDVAAGYLALGRYDEAKAVAEQSIAQKSDPWSVHMTLYSLAFIRGDQSAMQQEMQGSTGKQLEPILRWMQSQGECASGKLKQSQQDAAVATTVSQARGFKEFGNTILHEEAICYAETGFTQQARERASTLLTRTEDVDTRAGAALALATSGDSSRAQQLVDELAKAAPSDTMLNQVYLPCVRATISLQKNQPAQAVAQLESAIPYELGSGIHASLYMSNYIRGQAYLSSHDGAKAAAEFQKILDHRGVEPTNPDYTLSHLGLARAYAIQGDSTKAKTEYQNFFAAWKDADPDVPVLKTAKGEYEKLK